MKSISRIGLIAVFLFASGNSIQGQNTMFSYQGLLMHDGTTPSGLYEMQFTLFDAATNGNQIGTPVSLAPVSVSNGLFTVLLNFGSGAFDGGARWLEISVNTFGSDTVPVTLVPRQAITATPYALHADNAGGLMTFFDAPLEIKVNGQRALRLEPTTTNDAVNVVGGSLHNFVSTGVFGATIGGGGGLAFSLGSNSIASHLGVIGGGWANTIGSNSGVSIAVGSCGVIAGGSHNLIDADAYNASIGGGNRNRILRRSLGSTIAGGIENDVGTNSASAFIGGGSQNKILANSPFAAIPGGGGNRATNRAFAAGSFAQAIHTGAFVWADSYLSDIYSTNRDSVTMRANGGYRLFTHTNLIAGVFLAGGSGSWTSISDRNAKENFEPVNSRAILEKVAGLPLTTWNYKSQSESIRHIGPIAQDFSGAFGVGESNTGITTVDADGVALAAIQGLNNKVCEAAAIHEREVRALEEKNVLLEKRVETLERLLRSLTGAAAKGQ